MAKRSSGGKPGASPGAAKREIKSPKWGDVEDIRVKTSAALRSYAKVAADDYGDSQICVASEATRLVIGVPFPSFALEYLFQSNVLPLGRIMQLVGPPGTCKSGMTSEIARWLIAGYGGVAAIFESESKYSPHWVLGTIGWEYGDSLVQVPCSSVNDWQARLSKFQDYHKELMIGTKKEPGPGMVYPVLSVVDSIMGKSLEESQGRIDAAGFADRDFAVEAQSITKWLRYIPQRINQWPFLIVLVNQLKLSKDPRTQATVRNKAGGQAKEFQETMELEMAKIKAIEAENYDGLHLKLKLSKGGLGVTGRAIPATVRWFDLPNPAGEKLPWQQHCVWDWHGSTIELLTKMDGVGLTRRKKFLDLNVVKGRVWSKRLGIPESAPLPFDEAGLLLSGNLEVVSDLRHAFGVKEYTVLQPGVDYRLQWGSEIRSKGQQLRDILR